MSCILVCQSKTDTKFFCCQILKEIEENDIGIYRFPDLGGEDDEDVAAVSMKVLNKLLDCA